MLAAYFLKPHRHEEKADGRIMRLYTRLVTWSVRHRFITVLLGLILFVAAMASSSLLPSGFLPASDTARSVLAIELPPGSQLADTEAADRDHCEARAQSARGGERICRRRTNSSRRSRCRQGRTDDQLCAANQSDRSRSSNSSKRSRRDLADIPDIRYWFLDDNGQRNVNLIVTGDDNATVGERGGRARRSNAATADGGECRFRRCAQSSGAEDLPTPGAGSPVGRIDREPVGDDPGCDHRRCWARTAKFDAGDRTIPIRVLLEENARADRQVLEQLRVPSQRGRRRAARRARRHQFRRGATSIRRYDRQRQASVEADLVGGAALSQALEAINALAVMKNLPAGIKVTAGGDAELQGELFDEFGTAMRNGLMMVYVVLAILFASLLHPLTILFSLPLSITGAILALLIAYLPITLPVVIGILMLIGIVTKNAIMLVDFAVEGMHTDTDRAAAIMDAGQKRARPIIMTTIAMAAGMAPSAFALGAGGEFRSPMAIAVIGGLSSRPCCRSSGE